ncbi:hypothetical protein KDA_75790 [Dictyobacter alpinus]|uniref:Uncharacterized protein n=1 Tax=Dictyobacter alpinus TaxID=2014873 RepID=A0A402BL54_9CHLR|nr:hypothetical protein KDA_75790 [Dictyobacter alpinus]
MTLASAICTITLYKANRKSPGWELHRSIRFYGNWFMSHTICCFGRGKLRGRNACLSCSSMKERELARHDEASDLLK